MKTELYPLKFTPVLKEKIWGGKKLQTVLEKDIPSEQTGESWEISDIENSVSMVSNGALAGKSLVDLLEEYQENLVGKKVYGYSGNKFPLLFKFIDAKENLSLQLHPDDKLAKKRHNSLGKTEMWYIMQADKNAGIYVGFKKGTTKEDYLDYLAKDKLQDIMNFENVQGGEVFFIKPGLVHAIGEGVLLAEIQQSSDITYRVYDWDRKDSNGKGRELHTDLALEAIDFDFDDFKVDNKKEKNTFQNLVENTYFKTQNLKLEGELSVNYTTTDSFVVYMCVEGSAHLKTKTGNIVISKGETILIPACIDKVQLQAQSADLLEVTIG